MSIRRRSMPFACLLAVASIGVGCAEVITYSNNSVTQGERLRTEGRAEEAAGAFRNATQQNPTNYRAFYLLGETYQELGREQQALQSFKTAIEVMPNVDTRSRAEEAKAEVAFRDRAVDGLANCIAKSASRDAELTGLADRAGSTGKALDYYVLARTNVALGDADAAIDAYDRAVLASESRDAAILKSYGLYLAQIGQNARAEATLRKVYALRQDDADVNAALRKLGIVPGPSLLEANQMHRPVMPKGPLPELEINIRDQKRAAE